MAEDQVPGDAPENADKNIVDQAQEAASDVVEDVKETASDVADDVKEAAGDVKEEWNKMTDSKENKKMLVGILAIVLGSFGVHKFILGNQKEGIILAVATVIGYATSCFGIGVFILMATGIVGLIEGIIYLTKSDEEFYQTYQVEKKPWF